MNDPTFTPYQPKVVPICWTRPPYVTHRGCEVRETWVPIVGGGLGLHIELAGEGLTPIEHIEQQRGAA